MEKSRIPRTVVQGSVIGFWEANDFIFFLVVFMFLFLLLKGLIVIALFFIGLVFLNKVDKFRYKVGPGYFYRKFFKVDIYSPKGLPPFRILWRK